LAYSPPKGKSFPGVNRSEISTPSGHHIVLDYYINEQQYLFLYPLHNNLLLINGKSICQRILSHQHGLPGYEEERQALSSIFKASGGSAKSNLWEELYNQVFFTDNIPPPVQSVLKNWDQVNQLTPSTMAYESWSLGQNQEVKTFVNKIKDLSCNWN